MKEFKVEIPEGYEIDKEKSTFEKIVFKKKEKEEIVNCWEDIKQMTGVMIGTRSNLICYEGCQFESDTYNRNIFINNKYAKSALALAQISQLLPYYDSKVDWNSGKVKYCIYREEDTIIINTLQFSYYPIAFNTLKEAERFLKHNEQLVKDYYMLD